MLVVIGVDLFAPPPPRVVYFVPLHSKYRIRYNIMFYKRSNQDQKRKSDV